MKKTTYLAIACVVLLLAGGLYYFVKDEPLPPPAPPAQETKSDPAANLIFAGSSIIEEQNGKRLWEISAESIEVDPATKEVNIKNLKGKIYQETGGKVEIVANQATMDTKTRNMVMNGNIKAINDEGASFTAPEVRYVSQDRKFYGAGGIAWTRGDTTILGDRMESDAKLEKVIVQGNARVLKGGTTQ